MISHPLKGPPEALLADPGEVIPFPVQAPVQIKADLKKLGDFPIFSPDRQWPSWIAEKLELLQSPSLLPDSKPHLSPQSSFLIAPWMTEEMLESFWQEVSCAIAPPSIDRHASPLTSEGYFSWIGCKSSCALENFVSLTLSIQEDFALMVDDGQGGLRAGLLSICFPSGWSPKEKIGKLLQEIHEPVADNRELQAATPLMARAMTTKGPFIRHVWTLAGSGARRRDADEDTLAQASSISDLWFRCERQLTIPLSGRGSLFLIRVYVQPLLQVIAQPERKERLIEALRSMSQELVQYKGIARAREIILRLA